MASLQIGQTKSVTSPMPGFGCAPMLILDPISGLRSGKLPLAGGDMDDDPRETVLSEGGIGLVARGAAGEVGGASPRPLPKMRPPPSLRPDMMGRLPYYRFPS